VEDQGVPGAWISSIGSEEGMQFYGRDDRPASMVRNAGPNLSTKKHKRTKKQHALRTYVLHAFLPHLVHDNDIDIPDKVLCQHEQVEYSTVQRPVSLRAYELWMGTQGSEDPRGSLTGCGATPRRSQRDHTPARRGGVKVEARARQAFVHFGAQLIMMILTTEGLGTALHFALCRHKTVPLHRVKP